jgi:hypothetical protein
MEEGMKEKADRMFQEALKDSGLRDPRELYRQILRELKRADPARYDTLANHFQAVLVPSIASGQAEPLHAWREYGRLLAEAMAEGRTVAIDVTGRSHPYTPDVPMEWLLLHLPEAKSARAMVVSMPSEPSTAQKATYELLVRGSHRVPEDGQDSPWQP